MIGEASGIAPDRGLNILYRVTLNTLMNLTDVGLTQNNVSNAESLVNTRLSADTPKGILAGSIVMVGATSGTAVAATGVDSTNAIGIAINNAVGYPFESASGVGSGKVPYIHGTGSVIATDLYETFKVDGVTPIVYTPGHALISSRNGLLVDVSGKEAGQTLALQTIIGIVLIAPSTSDPFMVVQMLI